MIGITPVRGGLKELKESVLGGEMCAACGACVGLCPYIQCVEDRVAAVAECRKAEGRCFLFCPRAHPPDEEAPVESLLEFAPEIGPYRRVLQGRSAFSATGAARKTGVEVAGAQHGGTVTALLVQAFRSGLVKAAVLTRLRHGRPETYIARSEAEVLAAAGSKFAVAPTVAEVNQAILREDLKDLPLAVVALPCQAAALKRIRGVAAARETVRPAAGSGSAEDPNGTPAASWLARPFPNIALIIGLFCTWALSQQGWLRVLELARGLSPHQGTSGQEVASEVRRVEIPPPPANTLEVTFADGSLAQVSLEKVRPHIRTGCRVCADMTSECADVSIGLVEGRAGWNTVLTRSERGDALVRDAEDAALVEVVQLDRGRLSHLAEASLGKRRRAVATAAAQGRELPYLRQEGKRGSHHA